MHEIVLIIFLYNVTVEQTFIGVKFWITSKKIILNNFEFLNPSPQPFSFNS